MKYGWFSSVTPLISLLCKSASADLLAPNCAGALARFVAFCIDSSDVLCFQEFVCVLGCGA